MRYLAIDLGRRRTGLAVGETVTGEATPFGTLHGADTDAVLGELRRSIDAYGPDALVVGVPYHMDGSVGPSAERALTFADALERTTALPVHRVDERLTTFEAEDRMKGSGLSHGRKRARRDALAAAAILRDFLHRDD